MLSEVYLGLGSNLRERAANIMTGVELLRWVSKRTTISAFYEAQAVGFQSQPPFLNAVCRVWTTLDPFQLLAVLKEIERSLGHGRPFVNSPRILDIDILMYGAMVMESPGLRIPHPRMAERLFVLVPLVEIAPEVQHPVLGKSVRSLLARVENSGTSRVRLVNF